MRAVSGRRDAAARPASVGGASPSVKLLDASESVSLSHGWDIEEHVVVVVVVAASRHLTPHATRLKFASSRVVVSRRASAARAT